MSTLKLSRRSILKYTLLVFRSLIVSVVLVSLFLKIPVSKTWAASVSWVGGTDSNWTTATNWSTGIVPTSSDDVLIDVNATINLTTAVTVKSLTLGKSNGTATTILNFNYDAITVGALTIDGGNLQTYAGTTITHTVANLGTIVGRIKINVTTGDANIQGNINTDNKGYVGGTSRGVSGYGPGGGVGWYSAYGTCGAGGAGHASPGGSSCVAGGTTYQTLAAPTDLGSGGGMGYSYSNGTGAPGNGGGSISILAGGTITVSGILSAKGGNGGNYSGGGSGGSIYLYSSNITISGSLSVAGGAAGNGAGAGSAGRIVIEYSSTISNTGTIDDSTGTQLGTVYYKNISNNDLTIPHANAIWYSNYLSDWTFRNLYVNGDVTFKPSSTTLFTINVSQNITLGSNATLYAGSYYTTDSDGVGIYLNVQGDINVPSGTKISGNALGYIGGYSTSVPSGTGPGKGLGVTNHNYGDVPGGGGGYGGAGGAGYSGSAGAAYGSATAPTNLGSGGGFGNSYLNPDGIGGNGGSAIRLDAKNIIVDGTLSSNGGNGTAIGGGGSGGSIYINCDSISGAGVIEAKGGNGVTSGYGNGGNGGGGRIAINSKSFSWTGSTLSATVATVAGSGGNGGSNGTMYIQPVLQEPTVSGVSKTGATISTVISSVPPAGATDTGFRLNTTSDITPTIQPIRAYYFNESVNTNPLVDSIGGYNGTANGTTITTGKINGARSFNGSSDYITITRPVQDDFSICAWINTTTVGNGTNHYQYAPILDSEVGGYVSDFGFGIDSNGKLGFGDGDGTDYSLSGATTVSTGTWTFVCATRNKTTGLMSLYVNGALDGTKTGSKTSLTANSNARIGYGYDAPKYINGKIDDLLIYNTTLSLSDIQYLYNSSNGRESYLTATTFSKGATSSPVTMTQTLSSLTAGTTYYFKPYVIVDGVTVYGTLTSFTTAPLNSAPVVDSRNIQGADIYAGKEFTVVSSYSDPDGYTDLDKLYLKIHPTSGTDIEMYATNTGADQSNQTATISTGNQYVTDAKYNVTIANDVITTTWNISLTWNWIQSDIPVTYGIKGIDKQAVASNYTYTSDSYTYENRLNLYGSLTAKDSNDNTLTSSSWLSANEEITFSNIKIVYQGTTNIYPTVSNLSLKVTNDESMEWTQASTSGENITLQATSPNNTNTNDLYNFSIINIPTGGVDNSTLSFNIKTDKTNPVISSLTSSSHPNTNTWYNSRDITLNWEARDNQSGISRVLELIDQNSSVTDDTIIQNGEVTSTNSLSETLSSDGIWYCHLLVEDNKGLTVQDTFPLKIDTQNPTITTLSSPTHSDETRWYTTKTATFNWTTTDTGSGINNILILLTPNKVATSSEITQNGVEVSNQNTWTSAELTSGIWYVNILAKDQTGKTDLKTLKFMIDSSKPDIVAVNGKYNNTWQNVDAGPVITWTDPNSPSDNIFYITNDGTIPSATNWNFSTTDSTFDLPNQKEGETTIKVRAINKAGTYSDPRSFVVRFDSQAPANVSSLQVTTTNIANNLFWQNPTAKDFNKVVIMRDKLSNPTSLTTGTKIYEGIGTSYTDTTNIEENTKYYYTVFALDNVGNISSGSTTSITTSSSNTSPTTPEITNDTKVIKVQELSGNQQPTITSNQQTTNANNTGAVHVYTNQAIEVEVPAETVVSNPKDVKQVVLVLENQTYLMKYDSIKNTYKTTVSAPAVKGSYDTKIVTVSSNNVSQQAIAMTINVDPYGYIYAESNGNRTRISNATVTLYKKVNGEEKIWESTSTSENPQTTNTNGEYQFFVESGEYKIVVTAKGYKPTETEWFTVEGAVIEKNIEIKKDYTQLIIILAAALSLSFTIAVILITKHHNSQRQK